MKNAKKLIITVLLAAAVMMCMQMSAMAASKGTTYSLTDNSITVSWQAPSASYIAAINSYALYDNTTKTYVATNISANTTSCTISGISKGYVSRWTVKYDYTSKYGKVYTDNYHETIYVNTTPDAPLKTQYVISSINNSSKTVTFQTAKSANMSGMELELYKGKKRVKTIKIPYSYSDRVNIKMDTVYKYRARQYYTNTDTQQTHYGAWGPYRYFVSANATEKHNYSINGCWLTLKKISGVKNYTIRVSTSSKNGYKKTAKVAVSGKKQTFGLQKIGKSIMKNRTTYYIELIPNIIVGNKTVQSEVVGRLSFYNSYR